MHNSYFCATPTSLLLRNSVTAKGQGYYQGTKTSRIAVSVCKWTGRAIFIN